MIFTRIIFKIKFPDEIICYFEGDKLYTSNHLFPIDTDNIVGVKIISTSNYRSNRAYKVSIKLKARFFRYTFGIGHISKDKEQKKYDYFLKKMIEEDNISQNSKYLDSVYIDIDYYNLLDIEDKVYIGEFILSNEVYRFKYKFTKDNRYDEKISSIYNSFLNSNLVWYSIDKRYINKMYRIEVLEYIDDISLISDIAFCDLKLEYHLDSNIYLNKKIYWRNLKWLVF